MDEQKLKPHGLLEKIDYWLFYHFSIFWVIIHRRKIIGG